MSSIYGRLNHSRYESFAPYFVVAPPPIGLACDFFGSSYLVPPFLSRVALCCGLVISLRGPQYWVNDFRISRTDPLQGIEG